MPLKKQDKWSSDKFINLSTEDLRKQVEEDPNNAMPHYYLGKNIFKTSLEDIDSFEEIKRELTRALSLSPKLYMAHYYLGRLYFVQKNYIEAEKSFRDVIKMQPDSLLAREYLGKCLAARGILLSPEISSKSVRDMFYMFENEIRMYITQKLKKKYSDEWVREGIPDKIRGNCAKRREEGLPEEYNMDLVSFADFHDYRIIIEANKLLFHDSLSDIKMWQRRLSELEPIRNAIGHNRPIPEKAEKKINEYYKEFQKLIQIDK